MKRKVLLIFVVLILLSLPIFADDWYYGKNINGFTYTGLKNVTEHTVNSLLKPFVGKEFTDDLVMEIDNLLYQQDWMDYYLMNAEEGEDGELILNI